MSRAIAKALIDIAIRDGLTKRRKPVAPMPYPKPGAVRHCPRCGSMRLLLKSIGETCWTFRQRDDGIFERDDITEPRVEEVGVRLACLACDNEWPISCRTNATIERVGSS